MDRQAYINYWVETSDKDYRTMESLFESQDYHWALFLGHLVLEKLFKAIYTQQTGKEPPRIHDLVRLAEKCSLSLDDAMLDKLEMITRFNLNVRYPDYQQQFYSVCTKEFSCDALHSINEVRSWLKQLIRKS
jgi:HEPN domain-containing protein